MYGTCYGGCVSRLVLRALFVGAGVIIAAS